MRELKSVLNDSEENKEGKQFRLPVNIFDFILIVSIILG